MNSTEELADRYIAVWNELDEARRGEQIAQTYTEDATYLDPMMQGEGWSGINTMIGAAQKQFPGHQFHRCTAVETHHDRVRFSWELAPKNGAVVARGTDFGTVIGGRFQSVVGFLDTLPG